MRRIVLLFVCLCCLFGRAAPLAAAPACSLSQDEMARVAGVVDALTLRLASGDELRLLGLVPSAPPAWWKGPDPWPLKEKAKAALERLAAGRKISLHFDGPRRDRRGRLRAQVFVGAGEQRFWLQGRLVGQGHARAYAFADARGCAGALIAREAAARAQARGLWREAAYRVMPADQPDELLKRLRRFTIVEGRVRAVGRAQNWRFLNFGEEWRQDFTVAVAKSDAKNFSSQDIALDALKGRRLRVRGWVERWNGPAIKLTHPDQLELLEDVDALTTGQGG